MFYFISCLLLTGFWLLLTEGEIASLIVGVVFIPLSLFVSVKLSQKADNANRGLYINLAKIPKFILFFLYQSINGGISTAVRVFSNDMQLQPEFLHYPIKHLPAGLPMNMFMNLVSLLPGSVSVIREPTSVLVHVLAVTNSSLTEIEECEQAVCELFGLNTPAFNHPPSNSSDSSPEKNN